ncbi:MAG: hypothetical protein HC828_02110 [Blastochloris sp.]|nr:hypothetical protein [Blastochloris sp.]
MGLLSSVSDSPEFTGDVFISAAKLITMARIALGLDEASRLGTNLFCDNYGEDPENADTNPSLIWRGGFCYLAGVEDLIILTNSSDIVAGNKLRVRHGSTTVDLNLANGTQVHTVPVDASGYADGQPVELRISLSEPTPAARIPGAMSMCAMPT